MRPSLQNSLSVAPTTSYESKQVTGQPRFKMWGKRLYHLMEEATKKLWPCLMYHRELLVHINGRYKGALSRAASKCSQCITRNLSQMSSFSLLCSVLPLFLGKLSTHSDQVTANNHRPTSSQCPNPRVSLPQ